MNNEINNPMETLAETTPVETTEPVYEANEETSLLEDAAEVTENTEYNESTPMEVETQIPGVGAITAMPEGDVLPVEATEKAYAEAMEAYDLTDEETMAVFAAIEAFKSGKKSGLYDMLPAKVKRVADGIVLSSVQAGAPVRKNQAACFIVDQLIQEAGMNTAFDEYSSEFSHAIAETNAEFESLISSTIKDTFDKIDLIREEDPEKAERIQIFKDAFDKASNFNVQLEFLDRTSAKFLRKKFTRYDQEVFYVNKKINTTSIKIPDINELEPIIKMVRPELSPEEIRKFILVLCLSIEKLQIDMKENIANLAYVYRLISNIYIYKFASYVGEEAERVFGGITEVINKINNL